MSFGIYFVGYIILIAGLAIGGNLLHVPMQWIGVGTTYNRRMKKLPIFFASAALLFLFAGFRSAHAASITIGETAIKPTGDSGNGSLMVAQQATLSQTATIQSISFYVTVKAGKMRLGIYDATGPSGGPGAKKAETAEITPVVGWNTVNVITQVSLSPGSYWLAYLPSSNSLAFRIEWWTGSARYYAFPYGPMPATFSKAPNSITAHWSLYATLNTSAPPPPDTTAPSIPAGLSATAVSSSQINLSWNASTDNVGVAGYRIRRNNVQIATTASTSFQNTGLTPSTAYTYTVSAYDAAGNVSAASSSAAANTFPASPPSGQYGLEWPGNGAVRRMLYWHNPFPIYPATYIFKVYPRKKTSGPTGYYTTFFWGNDGTFIWDTGGNANTYYGAHPYPIPAPNGPGQWEISVGSNDFVTGSEVDWDRWYTQVFRVWRESPSITHHEFYYDWPDTSKKIAHTINDPNWASRNPPTPAIVMGQAPNLNGASWGGYPGWEEFNGIIRGIQIYSGLLSLADAQSEIASPKSTTAGQTFMWYMNLNPRPSDVTDKKGFGTAHNPSWDGTTALEWVGP